MGKEKSYHTIHPVVGFHAKPPFLEQLEDVLIRMGKFPADFSSPWPRETTEHLRRIAPAMIALDGLAPDADARIAVMHSPNLDPFGLKAIDGQTGQPQPLFLLGGDITVPWLKSRLLYAKMYPNGGPTASDLVASGIIKTFEEDMGALKQLQRDLHESGSLEIGALFFAEMAAELIAGKDSGLRHGIHSVRELDKIRLNLFRRFLGDDVVNRVPPEAIRLSRPINYTDTRPAKNNSNAFRDALLAIKLTEAGIRLGDAVGDRPRVALLGNGHKIHDQRLWNDGKQQYDTIKEGCVKVLAAVKEIAAEWKIDLGTERDIRNTLLNSLAKLLGATTVWEVKEKPEDMKVEDVIANLPVRDAFVSQTIANIVHEAWTALL